MPLYRLSVQNGAPIEDFTSYEFSDDEAARLEAEAVAIDLAANRPTGSDWKVVVTDENGRKVAVVSVLWMIWETKQLDDE